MPDSVPTSGPWQNDQQLQQLMRAALSSGMSARGSQTPGQLQAWQALNAYVNGNRRRLGIPDNYYPDPRNGGSLLYDPNQNVWRDIAITGAAMGAGAYALGSMLPAGAAPSGAGASASQAAGGLLPQTAPGAASAALTGVTPGLGLGNTGNLNGAVGSIGPQVVDALSRGGGGSILDKVKTALSGQDGGAGLASLASIIAGLAGGNGTMSGNSATDERLNALLDSAQRRTDRTDPLHQAVTQLAFSRLPVSSRNGISLTGK